MKWVTKAAAPKGKGKGHTAPARKEDGLKAKKAKKLLKVVRRKPISPEMVPSDSKDEDAEGEEDEEYEGAPATGQAQGMALEQLREEWVKEPLQVLSRFVPGEPSVSIVCFFCLTCS